VGTARRAREQARAQRRAEKRRPAAPSPAERSPWRAIRRAQPFAWAALALVFLVMTAMYLERRITWYLAVDQFGYLRFAHDLLNGQVHHDWPPARALAPHVPPQTDMLVQTYIWDEGRLYSRYAPGFPIVLAAWIGLFGSDAAHFLNPTLFLALLALVMAIQWRLARSLWRGTMAATLVVLCPTLIYLWALTATRDLSAHFFAFTGLAILVGRGAIGLRSLALAGLALGFAGSVRPDAVLYLIPASVLALGRWWSDRSWPTLGRWAAVGALGVALGLAPSLAFYWVATGNPFTPTQAVELRRLFLPADAGAAEPEPAGARIGYPPGWHGGTIEHVQGGGLRLSNLTTTLPGNLQKIERGYGRLFLALAAWGAVVGLYLRPAFTAAVLAYLAVAIPFFSCWTRPDHRYLIGVWLMMPMLITEGTIGTFDLVRRLARWRAEAAARLVAGVVALALVVVHATSGLEDDATPLYEATTWTLYAALLALGAAAAWPRRRIAPVAAAAIAVLLVVVTGTWTAAGLGSRASFQRAQAKRAAEVFRQTVEPNAVVITVEDVGRPMENIEYYGGIHSLYFTDLERWRMSLDLAAMSLIVGHFEPYVLVPAHQRERASVSPPLVAELVADIPPQRNYDYFVAAAFHRGLPMQLYRIRSPALEGARTHWEATTGKNLDATRRSP
jgi:4-amino-4-deoxy-L-arabinose transferase-like glycosyltransferase